MNEVREVEQLFPIGTRLYCPRNDKHYQIGTKHSHGRFWMLCEDDAERGLVAANLIMAEFKKA